MTIIEITNLKELDELGEIIGLNRLLAGNKFYQQHGIRFFRHSSLTFYRLPIGESKTRYGYYIKKDEKTQLLAFIEGRRKKIQLSLPWTTYERLKTEAVQRKTSIPALLQQIVEHHFRDKDGSKQERAHGDRN